MIKIQQISVIAIIAIGVGALLIPGTGLTQAAFAHHHGHGHSSISIRQSIHQENSDCSDTCVNVGINNAVVGNGNQNIH